MIVARRERRVEWGDCDPARIVFNPRFFEWFDAQTALIFETIGLPNLLQRPDFAGFPLVETRARFHRAVRFGDLIAIESRIVAVRKSSFEVEHRLTNGGEALRPASGRCGTRTTRSGSSPIRSRQTFWQGSTSKPAHERNPADEDHRRHLR